eukprot:g13302.t1
MATQDRLPEVMSVLERERKKLAERRKKYENNVTQDNQRHSMLHKTKASAALRLEESIQNNKVLHQRMKRNVEKNINKTLLPKRPSNNKPITAGVRPAQHRNKHTVEQLDQDYKTGFPSQGRLNIKRDLELLKEKYKKEFPEGTPIVVACELGRLEDLKVFVAGHDVAGTGVSVKEMLEEVGKDSWGKDKTPLQAAIFSEPVIDYLFEILLDGATDMKTLDNVYKKQFPKGTPIVVACEKGRLDDLKLFVAGHDVDGTGVSVKQLLEEVGTDSNGWQRNTLMAAAYYESHKVLVQLLDYGVDPSITDSYGCNALHISARGNEESTRCIETLLKKMPLESINKETNGTEYTPLDYAYDEDNLSPIKNDIAQLIRQHGGKANKHDRNGKYVGYVLGKGDLIHFLLDTSLGGATDMKTLDNVYKEHIPKGTPIVVACELGRLEDLKVFVAGHDVAGTGVSVKEMLEEVGKDSWGKDKTPLQAAIFSEPVIDYLFEILLDGATDMKTLDNVYKKQFPKGTPIVVACEKGRLDDLKLFVAGHDVDGTGVSVKQLLEEVGTDSNGWQRNTLMAAAYYESHKVLVQLLDYGVDPSITDSYGCNALHISARGNEESTRCIETLLKKMPLESINKETNGTEYTPLDYAYDEDNLSPIKNDIAQLIRQHGGKANLYYQLNW